MQTIIEIENKILRWFGVQIISYDYIELNGMEWNKIHIVL